ncbi:hypothetical protein [Bradyrhizobium sp. HKCCYLRH1030]|uniref:hypothetical protein n=1 Tax=Bradyrhizobium sp. HKCCYLRH1030 TaxID=3420744 RepID=UPI003EBB1A76
MNFMLQPTPDFEAIFDSEEICTSNTDTVASDWANASISGWTRILQPAMVRPLDVARLLQSEQDVAFFQVMERAIARLNVYAPIVLEDSVTEAVAPEPAELETSQLALSLSINFVPSEELIEVWRENVSHFPNGQAISGAKVGQASAEFSKMFRRLIGAFAQEKRYSGIRRVIVANENGEFDLDFQLDVSERFLLVPQKSALFFNLLYRDLSNFDDSIFAAGWGALVREPDKTLVLQLQPPNRIKREGFVKAREFRP